MFEELAHGVLDYLSRIQIDDPDDEQLDGTWQRAFDFESWEYFGSNADLGWGPYCVETGWSVAPAIIGAMLYLTGDTFFPDTLGSLTCPRRFGPNSTRSRPVSRRRPASLAATTVG